MAALPDVVFHYSGTFPDHLKVKKTLPLWPLRFSASLSYCIKEQAFYPKLSAKASTHTLGPGGRGGSSVKPYHPLCVMSCACCSRAYGRARAPTRHAPTPRHMHRTRLSAER